MKKSALVLLATVITMSLPASAQQSASTAAKITQPVIGRTAPNGRTGSG